MEGFIASAVEVDSGNSKRRGSHGRKAKETASLPLKEQYSKKALFPGPEPSALQMFTKARGQ
jgi:hypothetical protein